MTAQLRFTWPVFTHPHFDGEYEWSLRDENGREVKRGFTVATEVVTSVPVPEAGAAGFYVLVSWKHGRSGHWNHHFTTDLQYVEAEEPEEPDLPPDEPVEPEPPEEPVEPEPPEDPEPPEEPEPPIIVDPPDEPYVPSDRHPKEPAGFVPIFDHDFQTFPESHVDNGGEPASHAGHFVLSGMSAHLTRGTLIDDDGPHGYGKAVRVLWPNNFSVGGGFFNYAMRPVPRGVHYQDSPKFKRLYISH
jgi:hypothetical protein